MLRNEVVALPVREDPDGGFHMKLVLRLLPGVELDSALPELLPDWTTHGLAVTVLPAHGTAHGSPLDHPAYAGLVEAIEEAYPDARRRPLLPALERHRLALLSPGRHSLLWISRRF